MSIRIIKLPDVKAKTSLSRSQIYKLISEGVFPKQLKLSARSSGWYEHEIDAWLEERAKTRPA